MAVFTNNSNEQLNSAQPDIGSRVQTANRIIPSLLCHSLTNPFQVVGVMPKLTN